MQPATGFERIEGGGKHEYRLFPPPLFVCNTVFVTFMFIIASYTKSFRSVH
jgi:hypothetical protein